MHVKRLELSYFKSFGSTATIPLLPGFTVISGPNGSGKSNLLDAMLFALGLTGSKGMRAERLPDLVNQAQLKRGLSSVETKVTVTFDISDVPLEDLEDGTPPPEQPAEREWEVTRKLRVTKQGTYTSSYAINGEPCNLADLHDQMNRLRIYPEGYNVVLQGDVTGIISMNARQRREIIDELAGVGNFDRKINQAKEKLDAVKEQEDRFHIVEQELKEQCDRLDKDRIKAQKYQLLRAEFNEKSSWENVLSYRQLQQQTEKLQKQVQAEAQQQTQIETNLQAIALEIEGLSAALAELNAQVKALGEDEQLGVQAAIATQEAELRQLERQQAELKATQKAATERGQQLQQQMTQEQAQLAALGQQRQRLEAQTLTGLTQQRDQAQVDLERKIGRAHV